MSAPVSDFQLVLCTAGSQTQAAEIARVLVASKLAACVNIVPSICSIYRWEGKVVEEAEALLVIKTRRSLFPQVRETICARHSYVTPEVLALDLAQGDPAYLAWLDDSLTAL